MTSFSYTLTVLGSDWPTSATNLDVVAGIYASPDLTTTPILGFWRWAAPRHPDRCQPPLRLRRGRAAGREVLAQRACRPTLLRKLVVLAFPLPRQRLASDMAQSGRHLGLGHESDSGLGRHGRSGTWPGVHPQRQPDDHRGRTHLQPAWRDVLRSSDRGDQHQYPWREAFDRAHLLTTSSASLRDVGPRACSRSHESCGQREQSPFTSIAMPPEEEPS